MLRCLLDRTYILTLAYSDNILTSSMFKVYIKLMLLVTLGTARISTFDFDSDLTKLSLQN